MSIPELAHYRGEQLRVTGVIRTAQGLHGYCGLDIVRNALRNGFGVVYELEPGDATIYNLILVVEKRHGGQEILYVIYRSGHRIRGVTELINWDTDPGEFNIREAAKALAPSDEYTQNILTWFLSHLSRHQER